MKGRISIPVTQNQTTEDQHVTLKPRVLAFDWRRSLVMVLMTVDHSSEMFNSG